METKKNTYSNKEKIEYYEGQLEYHEYMVKKCKRRLAQLKRK